MVCTALAAAWDLLHGRIPNRITYTGMLAGVVLRGALGGRQGLLDSLAGGLVGGGVFLAFFLLRGMGAGDVKLMTAVGCLVGLRQTLVITLASAIAGGVLALAVMLFYRRGVRTLRNLGTLFRFHMRFGLRPHPEINLENPEAVRVPYALAIAAGTFYAFGMILLQG